MVFKFVTCSLIVFSTSFAFRSLCFSLVPGAEALRGAANSPRGPWRGAWRAASSGAVESEGRSLEDIRSSFVEGGIDAVLGADAAPADAAGAAADDADDAGEVCAANRWRAEIWARFQEELADDAAAEAQARHELMSALCRVEDSRKAVSAFRETLERTF